MSISEHRLLIVLLGAGLVLSSGCVEHAYHPQNRPGDYDPVPDPVSRSTPPEAGAIWRGDTASGSFLFFDRKARGVGDLITVLVVEDFSATGSASTSLGKGSSITATANSDIGLTDAYQKATQWFFRLLGADPGATLPAGTDVNALTASYQNDFDGDGTTSRAGSFQGVVTCRVLRVLPRGVFHIQGRRSIIVNHEEQVLTVEGLVRREDIGINNTVLSSNLGEARLAFDGRGVIDDKQRPSLVARVMDWLYPF